MRRRSREKETRYKVERWKKTATGDRKKRERDVNAMVRGKDQEKKVGLKKTTTGDKNTQKQKRNIKEMICDEDGERRQRSWKKKPRKAEDTPK